MTCRTHEAQTATSRQEGRDFIASTMSIDWLDKWYPPESGIGYNTLELTNNPCQLSKYAVEDSYVMARETSQKVKVALGNIGLKRQGLDPTPSEDLSFASWINLERCHQDNNCSQTSQSNVMVGRSSTDLACTREDAVSMERARERHRAWLDHQKQSSLSSTSSRDPSLPSPRNVEGALASPFYDPDFWVPRRPLAPNRVYHFQVIYNHLQHQWTRTKDAELALRITTSLVEKLEMRGYVNGYYHDRNRRSNMSLEAEVERVIDGTSLTILLLTPGFLRDCLERYLQIDSFRELLTRQKTQPCSGQLVIVGVGVSQASLPYVFDGHQVLFFREEDWEADHMAWSRFDNVLIQALSTNVKVQSTYHEVIKKAIQEDNVTESLRTSYHCHCTCVGVGTNLQSIDQSNQWGSGSNRIEDEKDFIYLLDGRCPEIKEEDEERGFQVASRGDAYLQKGRTFPQKPLHNSGTSIVQKCFQVTEGLLRADDFHDMGLQHVTWDPGGRYSSRVSVESPKHYQKMSRFNQREFRHDKSDTYESDSDAETDSTLTDADLEKMRNRWFGESSRGVELDQSFKGSIRGHGFGVSTLWGYRDSQTERSEGSVHTLDTEGLEELRERYGFGDIPTPRSDISVNLDPSDLNDIRTRYDFGNPHLVTPRSESSNDTTWRFEEYDRSLGSDANSRVSYDDLDEEVISYMEKGGEEQDITKNIQLVHEQLRPDRKFERVLKIETFPQPELDPPVPEAIIAQKETLPVDNKNLTLKEMDTYTNLAEIVTITDAREGMEVHVSPQEDKNLQEHNNDKASQSERGHTGITNASCERSKAMELLWHKWVDLPIDHTHHKNESTELSSEMQTVESRKQVTVSLNEDSETTENILRSPTESQNNNLRSYSSITQSFSQEVGTSEFAITDSKKEQVSTIKAHHERDDLNLTLTDSDLGLEKHEISANESTWRQTHETALCKETETEFKRFENKTDEEEYISDFCAGEIENAIKDTVITALGATPRIIASSETVAKILSDADDQCQTVHENDNLSVSNIHIIEEDVGSVVTEEHVKGECYHSNNVLVEEASNHQNTVLDRHEDDHQNTVHDRHEDDHQNTVHDRHEVDHQNTVHDRHEDDHQNTVHDRHEDDHQNTVHDRHEVDHQNTVHDRHEDDHQNTVHDRHEVDHQNTVHDRHEDDHQNTVHDRHEVDHQNTVHDRHEDDYQNTVLIEEGSFHQDTIFVREKSSHENTVLVDEKSYSRTVHVEEVSYHQNAVPLRGEVYHSDIVIFEESYHQNHETEKEKESSISDDSLTLHEHKIHIDHENKTSVVNSEEQVTDNGWRLAVDDIQSNLPTDGLDVKMIGEEIIISKPLASHPVSDCTVSSASVHWSLSEDGTTLVECGSSAVPAETSTNSFDSKQVQNEIEAFLDSDMQKPESRHCTQTEQIESFQIGTDCLSCETCVEDNSAVDISQTILQKDVIIVEEESSSPETPTPAELETQESSREVAEIVIPDESVETIKIDEIERNEITQHSNNPPSSSVMRENNLLEVDTSSQTEDDNWALSLNVVALGLARDILRNILMEKESKLTTEDSEEVSSNTTEDSKHILTDRYDNSFSEYASETPDFSADGTHTQCEYAEEYWKLSCDVTDSKVDLTHATSHGDPGTIQVDNEVLDAVQDPLIVKNPEHKVEGANSPDIVESEQYFFVVQESTTECCHDVINISTTETETLVERIKEHNENSSKETSDIHTMRTTDLLETTHSLTVTDNLEKVENKASVSEKIQSNEPALEDEEEQEEVVERKVFSARATPRNSLIENPDQIGILTSLNEELDAWCQADFVSSEKASESVEDTQPKRSESESSISDEEEKVSTENFNEMSSNDVLTCVRDEYSRVSTYSQTNNDTTRESNSSAMNEGLSLARNPRTEQRQASVLEITQLKEHAPEDDVVTSPDVSEVSTVTETYQIRISHQVNLRTDSSNSSKELDSRTIVDSASAKISNECLDNTDGGVITLSNKEWEMIKHSEFGDVVLSAQASGVLETEDTDVSGVISPDKANETFETTGCSGSSVDADLVELVKGVPCSTMLSSSVDSNRFTTARRNENIIMKRLSDPGVLFHQIGKYQSVVTNSGDLCDQCYKMEIVSSNEGVVILKQGPANPEQQEVSPVSGSENFLGAEGYSGSSVDGFRDIESISSTSLKTFELDREKFNVETGSEYLFTGQQFVHASSPRSDMVNYSESQNSRRDSSDPGDCVTTYGTKVSKVFLEERNQYSLQKCFNVEEDTIDGRIDDGTLSTSSHDVTRDSEGAASLGVYDEHHGAFSPRAHYFTEGDSGFFDPCDSMASREDTQEGSTGPNVCFVIERPTTHNAPVAQSSNSVTNKPCDSGLNFIVEQEYSEDETSYRSDHCVSELNESKDRPSSSGRKEFFKFRTAEAVKDSTLTEDWPIEDDGPFRPEPSPVTVSLPETKLESKSLVLSQSEVKGANDIAQNTERGEISSNSNSATVRLNLETEPVVEVTREDKRRDTTQSAQMFGYCDRSGGEVMNDSDNKSHPSGEEDSADNESHYRFNVIDFTVMDENTSRHTLSLSANLEAISPRLLTPRSRSNFERLRSMHRQSQGLNAELSYPSEASIQEQQEDSGKSDEASGETVEASESSNDDKSSNWFLQVYKGMCHAISKPDMPYMG